MKKKNFFLIWFVWCSLGTFPFLYRVDHFQEMGHWQTHAELSLETWHILADNQLVGVRVYLSPCHLVRSIIFCPSAILWNLKCWPLKPVSSLCSLVGWLLVSWTQHGEQAEDRGLGTILLSGVDLWVSLPLALNMSNNYVLDPLAQSAPWMPSAHILANLWVSPCICDSFKHGRIHT